MSSSLQLDGKIEERMERPRVPAAIHPAISRFLADQSLVRMLIDGFGSPLNIMFPQHIRQNIAGFQQVMQERQLQGRLYFTHKPNKSQALVREVALTGIGLDVSSEGELVSALKAGFNPSRIEATGPKSPEHLALCLQQGVLLNIDNLAELAQAEAMVRTLGRKAKAPIMVRLDGFTSERVRFASTHDTTFGVRVSDVPALFEMLERSRDVFDFQGFAFHSNAGGEMAPRLPAVETCLELTFAAMQRGFKPRALNIGGGYRISYAANHQDWIGFTEALKEAVLGTREPITWDKTGLGYRNEGGLLRGSPHFMEHYHKSCGPADMAAVFDAPLAAFDNASCARLLSENLIELIAEPGRALLDQTGVTLGRVTFVKPSMQGETLVGLEMNRSHINATQLKCLTDPLIVPLGRQPRQPCPGGVLYTGNLCLSENMIQYQKTWPDFLPQQGDVIAFINTAAYQMDNGESEVLQQRLAEKIAVIETENGFRWFRDDLYSPLTLLTEDLA